MSKEPLINRISFAQDCLHKKLIDLRLESLSISEYNQRYIENKKNSLAGVLQIYGRLLAKCLGNCQIPLEEFTLVDYGGGSGIISFLAAEIGFGKIIYNDIYDVSCKDVEILAAALNFKLDGIVCGDVDSLVSYLDENSININAITSYDVLEHIYDVESHFQTLASLRSPSFRIVYASGANSENPLCKYNLKKQQLNAEFKTRKKKYGHKDRDSILPYLEVRKRIISTYAPDLSPEVVKKIAIQTRGLIEPAIHKCVDEYRFKGSIDYRNSHPTNTCDPNTGNWCEHLINFNWLQKTVQEAGFSAKILAGCYHTSSPMPKKIAKIILNVLIYILGRRGMLLAPYYIVYAEKNLNA